MSEGRVLSALVANRPGVLNRVSGLIRRRGFNIENLTVGPTLDHTVSRMTLVVNVGAAPADQAVRQLAKLIDVIDVRDITDEPRVECELILIRVENGASRRGSLVDRAGPNARVVAQVDDVVILAVTGSGDELDDVLQRLRGFDVKGIARTGIVSMMIDETHPHAVHHWARLPERDGEHPEETDVMSIV
jgi:acetolactate synthase I/III small subunit